MRGLSLLQFAIELVPGRFRKLPLLVGHRLTVARATAATSAKKGLKNAASGPKLTNSKPARAATFFC